MDGTRSRRFCSERENKQRDLTERSKMVWTFKILRDRNYEFKFGFSSHHEYSQRRNSVWGAMSDK